MIDDAVFAMYLKDSADSSYIDIGYTRSEVYEGNELIMLDILPDNYWWA